METYDFSGWATKANMKCSDGRTIMKNAFIENDGTTVPLVWNHQHNEPFNVLGHALLENRNEGVYAYCKFNDSEAGRMGREMVRNGDVNQLSIYANKLKQQGGNVLHGAIREVSLVLAGANPGAYIDSIMCHGAESDEDAIIYTGEDIELAHAEDENIEAEEVIEHAEEKKEPEQTKEVEETKGKTVKDVFDEFTEEQKTVVYALIGQALEDAGASEDDDEKDSESTEKKASLEHADNSKEDKNDMAENKEKTVKDVFDEFTEEQKTVVYALIGQALEDAGVADDDDVKHSEGGNDDMYHNIFDREDAQQVNVLSHADQEAILNLAKSPNVGSLRMAMDIYAEQHSDSLAHGYEDIEQLFPDYKDVHPGAPELLERDHNWVGHVMSKAHKSPVSRVRTRQLDARAKELRAKGYNNREEQKALSGNLKLLMRTTDPQTVYYRDALHRDDITDITDFDVVAYQRNVMKRALEEEIALAALVGDGREDTDADKIHEEHIRPIWKDEDLYTIKAAVDIAAAKKELQGSDTSVHFGDNYIYAEAVVTAALYAREKYKGKGALDFYCAPHLLNVMLLARDLNGRRIYDTKEDLAKVLNVANIFTVEQFEGLQREDAEGKKFNLLGLFVNMGNYQFGATKGGEITNFEDFDIDFNTYKYLMETRLSGALTEVYSAIALEEPVEEAAG